MVLAQRDTVTHLGDQLKELVEEMHPIVQAKCDSGQNAAGEIKLFCSRGIEILKSSVPDFIAQTESDEEEMDHLDVSLLLLSVLLSTFLDNHISIFDQILPVSWVSCGKLHP